MLECQALRPVPKPGSVRSSFRRPAWPGRPPRVASTCPGKPELPHGAARDLSGLAGALQRLSERGEAALPPSPASSPRCTSSGAGGWAHSPGLVTEGDERGAWRGVQDLLGARVQDVDAWGGGAQAQGGRAPCKGGAAGKGAPGGWQKLGEPGPTVQWMWGVGDSVVGLDP